ncbi:MAG TPA: polysaccharide biosynthesis/export family protein [Steroidobacteraceae bacterium]|jgi:polysaccharide export outer membrane protein
MSGWYLSLLAALAVAAVGFPACAAAGSPPTGTRVAVAATIPTARAADSAQLDYRLQPGDIVTISVWKEKDLDTEALVRPDGGLSFPLVGDIEAKGHTLRDVRAMLAERLKPYIPDPVVTVAVKEIGGDHVYVIGRVTRPGEYPFSQPIDVMQALSLAGGATPFASLNHIVILHRDSRGEQHSMRFRYADVAHGRDLSQNVLLQSGDTVVVP